MQSWMALLIAGMLIGPVAGSTVAYADTPTVSTETQTAVTQAYDQWSRSLGARQACSAGVTVVYEELSGRRGEYRTGDGQVVIDPTDSATGLNAIVAHELSHHTFLACGAFADAEFTDAFYASQGLPAQRDWFDYSAGWSAAPAEHFAEAMAAVIVGAGEGGIAVAASTKDLISRWLAGAPIVSAPADEEHEPVPYSSGGPTAEPVLVGDRGSELPDTTQEAAPSPAPTPDEAEIQDEVVVVPNWSPVTVFWLYTWRSVGPL